MRLPHPGPVPSRTSPLARALLAGLGLLLAASLTACVPASSQTVGHRVEPVLGAHNDTSTPFNLVSVPALTKARYDGRGLRLTRVLARELAFTRYAASYRSGRLLVTGVLDVPTRPGRHPVVVMAHGWWPPSGYTTGSMLGRESELLAARGYVTFRPDYRNYGGSSLEDATDPVHPLGYPQDLVNAVLALREAALPFADTGRMAYFGRSMGGGVVLQALAARPRLVDAAVLYSPVSSSAVDTYERWVVPEPGLLAKVTAAYGTPRTRPAFWRQASARTYLGRVHVPVQVHHGTADTMCPVGWSRATVATLRRDGDDARLFTYPGEPHRFGASWPLFMHRAAGFLDAHLHP